jgi:hypothetical protein
MKLTLDMLAGILFANAALADTLGVPQTGANYQDFERRMKFLLTQPDQCVRVCDALRALQMCCKELREIEFDVREK